MLFFRSSATSIAPLLLLFPVQNAFKPFLCYCTSSSKYQLISHYFSLLHTSPNFQNIRHLHARLLRTSLYNNVILSSKLIIMYSKHSKLVPDGHAVFLHMPERNIYSWNIVIGESARSGFAAKSIELFAEMLNYGVKPDVFTLPLVLRACASFGPVNPAAQIHSLCVKLGVEKNVFVASALVHIYVAMGKICHARQAFDKMPQRDAVLWTAMVAGYAQNGEPMRALEIFREMMGERIELDGVVMVSLLLICGQLGCLRHGKSVHGWTIRKCIGLGLSLGNALVDAYGKCGSFDNAQKVFDEMPERDVISWSAMILGYGMQGSVVASLELFERMMVEEIRPNAVTFLGVLSACAHAGLVEQAGVYFDMMGDFGVVPELKHYACMVDVLGRAGRLTEAESFILEMPIEPDGAVWGALLGGCRVHGNVEVGERAAMKLLELDPERSGYYVLLANIYSAAGQFDDAERVRDSMKERKVFKVPGRSSIELDGCSPFSRDGIGSRVC